MDKCRYIDTWFYEYIGNIAKILVDILTKISMRGKLFKIHKNAEKTQKKKMIK